MTDVIVINNFGHHLQNIFKILKSLIDYCKFFTRAKPKSFVLVVFLHNILKTFVYLIPQYNSTLPIYKLYTTAVLQSTRMCHHVLPCFSVHNVPTNDITSDRIDFLSGPRPTRAPRGRPTGWLRLHSDVTQLYRVLCVIIVIIIIIIYDVFWWYIDIILFFFTCTYTHLS